MADDLFANVPRTAAAPLTIFRVELLSEEPARWEELVEGCTALKAITFSSSLEFLLRLAEALLNGPERDKDDTQPVADQLQRIVTGLASRIMRLSTWTARATSPC